MSCLQKKVLEHLFLDLAHLIFFPNSPTILTNLDAILNTFLKTEKNSLSVSSERVPDNFILADELFATQGGHPNLN